MKALYSNIKALRIAKGWSQEELALRLGYKDRSMLAKIEAGKVDITVGKVEAFADAFGVAPVDLIGWRDDTADGIAAIYAQLNNEGKRTCFRGSCRVHFGPPQCSWDECVYCIRGRVYRHSVPA